MVTDNEAERNQPTPTERMATALERIADQLEQHTDYLNFIRADRSDQNRFSYYVLRQKTALIEAARDVEDLVDPAVRLVAFKHVYAADIERWEQEDKERNGGQS